MEKIDRFAVDSSSHFVRIVDRYNGKDVVLVQCMYTEDSVKLAELILPIVDEFVTDIAEKEGDNDE